MTGEGAAVAPTQRPYQLAASEALERTFFDLGQNRALIKKPTGTGKTVWFANLLKLPRLGEWVSSFKQKGATLLVIAHREELLDQAADKIRRANPKLMVDIEQGDRHASHYADVVIASIQTLSAGKGAARFRRLKRFMVWHTPRIVVVDEAHHAAAKSYRTALAMLGFLPKADISDQDNIEAATHDDVVEMEKALAGWDAIAPKDRLLIGVTATPNRSDAVGLGCVFQTIAFSYPLKQAINDGWLTPITSWAIDTKTSLEGVRTTAGDFNQKELAEAVNNAARNQQALAAWREHADGIPTIGFTVDVAHAHEVAALFAADGVKAVALSGETPREDRRRILRQFEEGTIEVVFNCMVLTEGTDLPRTGCILHLKPTKSPTLYEQMTGRGLRPHPDDPKGPERLEALERGETFIKRDCIVIDLVDLSRRHSLQTAPVLYGLPPTLIAKGDDLRQMEEKLEELLAKYPGFDVNEAGRLTLEQLNAKASLIDVWAIPELGAFGKGRALDWVKFAEDSYQLQYPWADGIETITVMRDLLGKFEVVCSLRPKEGPATVRQRTLANGVPSADAAAGLAEAFVLQERRSVMKLAGKDEDWKKRPASEKQKGLLRRLRVPLPAGPLTMGQAGRLIDLAFARKGRR